MKKGSCPCLFTTPCSPRCTCVHGNSSFGCSRCCSYGSLEQKTKTAERIAKLHDEPTTEPARLLINQPKTLTGDEIKTEPAKGEWMFGSLGTLKVSCSGYHVRNSEGKSVAFVFDQQTAAQIVEDHNNVQRLKVLNDYNREMNREDLRK